MRLKMYDKLLVPHGESYPDDLLPEGAEFAHLGNRGNPYGGFTSVLQVIPQDERAWRNRYTTLSPSMQLHFTTGKRWAPDHTCTFLYADRVTITHNIYTTEIELYRDKVYTGSIELAVDSPAKLTGERFPW